MLMDSHTFILVRFKKKKLASKKIVSREIGNN